MFFTQYCGLTDVGSFVRIYFKCISSQFYLKLQLRAWRLVNYNTGYERGIMVWYDFFCYKSLTIYIDLQGLEGLTMYFQVLGLWNVCSAFARKFDRFVIPVATNAEFWNVYYVNCSGKGNLFEHFVIIEV